MSERTFDWKLAWKSDTRLAIFNKAVDKSIQHLEAFHSQSKQNKKKKQAKAHLQKVIAEKKRNHVVIAEGKTKRIIAASKKASEIIPVDLSKKRAEEIRLFGSASSDEEEELKSQPKQTTTKKEEVVMLDLADLVNEEEEECVIDPRNELSDFQSEDDSDSQPETEELMMDVVEQKGEEKMEVDAGVGRFHQEDNQSQTLSSSMNNIALTDTVEGDDMEEGCEICLKNDNTDKIMMCDTCDKEFHMYCLKPPLLAVPSDDWLCPECIKSKISTSSSPQCAVTHSDVKSGAPNTSTNSNPLSSIASFLDPSQTSESVADLANECLIHVCSCDKDDCDFMDDICRHFKRFLRGTCWASHQEKWLTYQVSKILSELFAFHSLKCVQSNCLVPLCSTLKSTSSGN